MKDKLYVGYLTAGDGGLNYSLESALALIQGGVNVLEIGVPFSDPIADGPVIQKAMQRSLLSGTTPVCVLKLIENIRRHTSIPLILFSYCNPLLQGGTGYLQAAKEAGATGMIVVDLPLEENLLHCDLDRIQLIAPSTPVSRLGVISAKARGFVYYVCQKGTTGKRSQLPEDLPHKIRTIKQHISLPVVVGFGISSSEQVRDVVQVADGFVVGSYFVEAMGRKESPERLSIMARNLIS